MGMIGNYLSIDAKKLESVLDGEVNILDLEEEADPEKELFDIDKSWQAIQYLLCQDIDEGESPMGYVVPMMIENGIECEMDFGAFYLTSEQVQETRDYLCALSDDEIKQMYDFQSMVEDEIYPLVEGEDEDEFYEYMFYHLSELKEFYKRAAGQGHAVIFYIM
ncbi:DUF1877 family protein [Clostridiales bacterium COT073_COT-073]|nr:DUF1877 family protein [Clostridiales bacterium COT073_COT-073]